MAWSERRPVRAILWSGLAALALTLSPVAPAAAHGTSTPTYKAVLSPTAVAAGSNSAATITLTQLVEDDWGHGKELGSVLIGPPSGVVVTGASAVRGATALPVAVVSGSVKVARTSTCTMSARPRLSRSRPRSRAVPPGARRGRSSATTRTLTETRTRSSSSRTRAAS